MLSEIGKIALQPSVMLQTADLSLTNHGLIPTGTVQPIKAT